jgi:hypothetical protein
VRQVQTNPQRPRLCARQGHSAPKDHLGLNHVLPVNIKTSQLRQLAKSARSESTVLTKRILGSFPNLAT